MNNTGKPVIDDYSEAFLNKIEGIISNAPTTYLNECSLSFANGANVSIPGRYVTKLSIYQNYHDEYMDGVKLRVQLTRQQYLLVWKHRQGMTANVSMSLQGLNASDRPTQLFYKRYRVVLKNIADPDLILSQSLDSGGQLPDSEASMAEVTFELLPDHEYHSRKKGVSMILHNATMEQAMITFAQSLGYSRVHIVPPDNTKKYKNLIIPAFSKLTDVFDYLQHSDGYDGVYITGITHYIQDGVLYVYPLLGYPTSAGAVNFFNAGESFSTAQRFHMVSGNTLNVVITNKVDVVDMTQVVAEDRDHMITVCKPKMALTATRLTSSDKSAQVRPVNNMVQNLYLDNNELGSDLETFSHGIHNGNNSATPLEELYANGVYQIAFNWTNACPFIIRPSTSVKYLVDTSDGIREVNCSIRAMRYDFESTPTADTSAMVCNARIMLQANKNVP